MPEQKLQTPVLLLIFNRPDTMQLVFDEIRKAKPAQLFVAADGPRKDRSDDRENCRKAREIIQQVDWDCKVSTLFRDENLGCKRGVSSAIDWFFSHVEEGIILEDDCVPDQSFFPFCQELLERYRDDERVVVISGDNFQCGRPRTEYSYYFSRYLHIWGWASWRRAWNNYDVSMKLWPLIRDGDWLMDILDDRNAVNYWTHCFEDTHAGKIDTWDYEWVFACWIRNELVISPSVNLVSNIGFDQFATHTKTKNKQSDVPVHQIGFPLKHPPFIIRDNSADKYSQKHFFSQGSLVDRIKGKIMTILSSIFINKKRCG
jgi:hypothetical protein